MLSFSIMSKPSLRKNSFAWSAPSPPLKSCGPNAVPVVLSGKSNHRLWRVSLAVVGTSCFGFTKGVLHTYIKISHGFQNMFSSNFFGDWHKYLSLLIKPLIDNFVDAILRLPVINVIPSLRALGTRKVRSHLSHLWCLLRSPD